MSDKHKYFIYDRREMWILVMIVTVTALFAFTLGVHLGKNVKVGAHGEAGGTGDHAKVETQPDAEPGRVEIAEQNKGVDRAIEGALNKSLHDEVVRTGIKADPSRAVDLPEETKAPAGGATTLQQGSAAAPKTGHEQINDTTHTAAANATKPSAKGKFTLQIGSFPSKEDADARREALVRSGLEAFLAAVDVKGEKRFRVYVGGFASVHDAEEAADRYKRQQVIDAFIVATMPDTL